LRSCAVRHRAGPRRHGASPGLAGALGRLPASGPAVQLAKSAGAPSARAAGTGRGRGGARVLPQPDRRSRRLHLDGRRAASAPPAVRRRGALRQPSGSCRRAATGT